MDDLEDNRQYLPIDKACSIMSQMFEALEILHQVGYTHNDIKPGNIMLDDNLNMILIDIGFTT